jgi:SnoaL-like domain
LTADEYFAIQRLINIYFVHVDAADFDAAGALFAHADMVYTSIGRVIAHDGHAVADLMRQSVQLHGENAAMLTRHHCGNIIIEPDGDGAAKAQCSAIIFQATPHLPLQPIAEASYVDTFKKTDGLWHFTRRAMRLNLIGNLSQHLAQPLTST